MLDIKEKQQRILRAFDLKVGDKIKFTKINFPPEPKIYEIKADCLIAYNDKQCTGLDKLYYFDWEKVVPEKIVIKKKFGDFTCRETFCPDCPLHDLSRLDFCVCKGDVDDSIYKTFELTKADVGESKYVTIDWDAIKAELDKEVEREDFE